MSKPAISSDQFPRKFGKYHLLAPLAQGGMGALYLAVTGDRGLERLMCIKTVLPHLADKEYVARFRDEAKIVVQLSHGNLIPVFDAGQVAGELFLAMEFVKGKDLRAVWNRCAKKAVAFPVDVAVYLTKELCRGLGYAHGYGDIELVHRDVSPPNVLISYSGEVKLTDFGLASSTLKLEKTAPGIIYGKVAYMSPEQARGEKLDGRSDIYAAGIILWELLTGRQLFPPGAEQPQDLIKRARNPEAAAPSERAPRVPKDLDAIVLKALAADREQRYERAEDFRDALGEWLAVHAPSTDAGRVERFLHDLFEEDIVEEEAERRALMEKTRERVKTLPPTDELRRLLEGASGPALEKIEKATDRRQDEGPNLGRRGADKGEAGSDRRSTGGRRKVDAFARTASTAAIKETRARGIAVDVPNVRADGATVVPSRAASQGGSALAQAELPDHSHAPQEIVGQVLENRYQIKELVGEGGMGRVYLAEHVDIGKQVAVKVLHPVYGRMPDLVERFRREARAASKIGHPNIVDVTDSGTTEDGSVYFVMEYLEGVELAAVIDREGAIDIRRGLDISAQICRALSAAHAAGIIHRDLKPENIFLTSREGTSDFVKVLDFGIAKSSEAEEARAKKLTHPGMAMGTPEYMAPEQAAGKAADERCDVYAVGAILYEMLTGTPPYDGENFMEILTKKATLEPTPARELRPEISEDVEALLERAMARKPEDRPPSMEAFEYELTKCLAGRSAAVANILGIAHDADLGSVDTPFFEGPRDELTSPGHPVPTQAQSKKHGSELNVPVAESRPLDFETEAVPNVSGGGFRALGWSFFVVLLLAGAAAVFYVAKGEGSAKGPAPGETTGQPAAPPDNHSAKAVVETVDGAPSKPEAKIETVDKGSSSAAAKSDAGPAATADKGRDKGSDDGKAETAAKVDEPDASPKGKSGPPRSAKEAARLLAQAKGMVANMQYDEARNIYKRIIKGKHRKQQGYLGLADVAFQQKNADLAITYAKKAGNSVPAKMALGNAYFKKGDYRSALKIYEQVLKRSPKHKEALRSAKEARKRLE